MEGLIFLIIGGLFEPAWVLALEKAGMERKNPKRRAAWLAAMLFFTYLSLFFMSRGMLTMDVGISYAIWTAVGALATIAISRVVNSEELGSRKILAISMIIIGIAGLEIFAGGSS
jgi:multidrug transporter EmrE-like cation transporter